MWRLLSFFFFFFKQKTAYEMQRGLVGSEMCIRDSVQILSVQSDVSIKLMTTSCFFLSLCTRPTTWRNKKRVFDFELYIVQIDILSQCFNSLVDVAIVFRGGLHKINAPSHVLCVDTCLLYTSDAADDTPCVDLGGRRIIKKKKQKASADEASTRIRLGE
eukprot:TRINITY_DN11698_c0_g1_i2.p1 TRINITY_DN11698_c0_g1~~TRINITY_DN11698_c0_g1_i2.p1  ORF type:complete len:160 (+),score=37.99 TRINITY_DN11698_c0_g1_i2:52-531(+)